MCRWGRRNHPPSHRPLSPPISPRLAHAWGCVVDRTRRGQGDNRSPQSTSNTERIQPTPTQVARQGRPGAIRLEYALRRHRCVRAYVRACVKFERYTRFVGGGGVGVVYMRACTQGVSVSSWGEKAVVAKVFIHSLDIPHPNLSTQTQASSSPSTPAP